MFGCELFWLSAVGSIDILLGCYFNLVLMICGVFVGLCLMFMDFGVGFLLFVLFNCACCSRLVCVCRSFVACYAVCVYMILLGFRVGSCVWILGVSMGLVLLNDWWFGLWFGDYPLRVWALVVDLLLFGLLVICFGFDVVCVV